MSKPTLERIDPTRLSPQSRWALQHLALPKSEEDLTDQQLADRTELQARQVKRMLEALHEEVRAQQLGAEIPTATGGDYETLKKSIERYGLLYPILVDQHGNDLDGGTRRRACAELGIEPDTRVVHVRDAEEARAIGFVANLSRRQLAVGKLKKLAAAEILHDPSRSDRAIAELLGVSYKTVGRARKELLKLGMVGHGPTRVGRDGVTQPVRASERRYRLVIYDPDGQVVLERTAPDLAELLALDLAAELAERSPS